MSEKEPFVPTRTCPHRWCRLMHIAPLPFVLALIAFDLWHNWVYLLVLTFFVFVAWWVQKTVHMKRRPRSMPTTFRDVIEDIRESPTPFHMEMEDAKYSGTGWRMLEVRKGWARVAVGCDMFLVLNVGLAITSMVADPVKAADAARHSTSNVVTYISFGVGMLLFAFNLYAHKKATQPRKPKRAWLPAFLRTNT